MGLSLAQLLSQAFPARQITLIDRFSLDAPDCLYQPSFDYRSTAISRDSADIFEHLGVWAALSEHATAIRRVHVSDRGHAGKTSYSEEDNNGQALGYVVDNAWLGRVLAEQALKLPNVRRLAPAVVNSLRMNVEGARIEIAENDQAYSLQCQLAIVADGADSAIRQSLGIMTDDHNYHQSAVIANVAFEKSHQGVAYERFTEEGPVALLPHGESDSANTSSLVWTTPETKVDEVLQWSDEAFLSALQKAFGYRLGKFTKVGARLHYPLRRVVAKEQARSAVVLMGNAAHALHPVAGQGFNLALRDAECLTATLLKASEQGESLGSLRVLTSYVAQQQKDQWLTTNLSHGFNRIFADTRLPIQGVRNAALITLNLGAPIKKSFFDHMMGKTHFAPR